MHMEVGSIHLGFPLDLSVGQVLAVRAPGDTLLAVERLHLSPEWRPLLERQVRVPQIQLRGVLLNYTDSTGLMHLVARLPEAGVERLSVDLTKQRISLGRLMTLGGDVYYSSTDTTTKPKEDKEPLRWIIEAGEISLQRTRVQVAMPLDSLYLNAEQADLRATGGYADLGRMLFRAQSATLRADSLGYAVDVQRPLPGQLDPQHIGLRGIALDVQGVESEGMRLSLEVNKAQLRERSGLQLSHLSGRYRMDSLGMQLEDLILQTAGSSLTGRAQLPWSVLRQDPRASFELALSGRLSPSEVLLLSGDALASFDPRGVLRRELRSGVLAAPIQLSTQLAGSLSSLRVGSTSLRWPQVLEFSASGQLASVLSERQRAVQLELSATTEPRLETLVGLFAPNLLTSYHLPAGLRLRGRVGLSSGRYTADVRLTDTPGDVTLRGSFAPATERYEADLRTSGLDLRRYMIGGTTGRVDVNLHLAGRGFEPLSPRTEFNLRGELSHLAQGEMLLEGISLTGSLHGGALQLALDSRNPGANLRLALGGSVTRQGFSSQLDLQLADLDLHRLGFSTSPLRGSGVLVGSISSDLKDTHHVHLTGQGLQLQLDTLHFAPPEFTLGLESSPQYTSASLVTKGVEGQLQLGQSPSRLQATLPRLIDESMRQVSLITSGKSATKPLESLVALLPEGQLSLTLERDNPLRYYLTEQRIALGALQASLSTSPAQGLGGQIALSDLQIDTLRINSAQLNISTDHVPLAERDSMSLVLFGSVMKSRYRSQSGFTASTDLRTSLSGGRIDFTMQDEKGEVMHSAELDGSWSGEAYRLHLVGDRLRVAYNDLLIGEHNELRLRKRDNFLLGSLGLTSTRRGSLLLRAEEPVAGEQDLNLSIQGVHLEDFRELGLPDVGGIFFGDIHYQRQGDLSKQPTISGDLSLSELRYEDKKLGHFTTSLFYEPRSGDSHYITADVGYNGQSAMSIDGIYYPQEKRSPLQGTLRLTAFPLALANPFLSASGTTLSGTAGGSISLSGKLSEPELSGSVQLSDALVDLQDYATHLRLDTIPLRLAGSELLFDHYAIRPEVDPTKAIYIDGSIREATSPRATAALRITSDELTLLNEPRPRTEDQLIYGRVIASTAMQVTGPMTSLRVRGGVNILSGTNCNYVLREDPLQRQDGSAALVEFVDFSDTLLTKRPEVVPPSLGGLDVNLTINVDPSVRVGADLTADGVDYLHAQGGGSLHFTYPPYGEMSLTGRYEMSGGGELSYSLPVVGNKRFTIDPTSTLSWNGPVANPYLNLLATHQVRASVTEAGSSTSQRVNFHVGVSIQDYVSQMNLGFTLSAPENLSMQNTLSTMTKEEQGKQAIALMATGIYLGDNAGAGNLNLNTALTSLLQSQINRTAGKLLAGTDLSLGMDRHDGSDGSAARTDYTYSFSRRFYNDRIRVIVGGKVQSGAGVSASSQTFLDNVSLQYQLDKSGEQYLSLYHKLVSDNVLEGEFTETGLGYVMRRKLANLLDLFSWLRKRPKPTAAPALIRREWAPVGDSMARPAGGADSATHSPNTTNKP